MLTHFKFRFFGEQAFGMALGLPSSHMGSGLGLVYAFESIRGSVCFKHILIFLKVFHDL